MRRYVVIQRLSRKCVQKRNTPVPAVPWPPALACGTKFSIEHALSCPKGGSPSIQHNEIRDLTANLLTEICNDVSIEPELPPIDGEVFTGTSSYTQDGARLLMVSGVVDLNVPSLMCEFLILMLPTPSLLQNLKHELEKKRHYEQRVREVEPHASFTLFVLSATGGRTNEATVFYKRLASCLATKWDLAYSRTMSWLRCRLTFSLAVDMQPNFRLHQWT